MEERHSTPTDPASAGLYEIRLRGEIDDRWAAWFDGLAVVTPGDGTTVLTGHFADQAAFHGALERIRDLGLELIAVTRSPHPADPEPDTSSTDKKEGSTP